MNWQVRIVLAELPSMMAALVRAALDEAHMTVMETDTYREAVSVAASVEGFGVVIVPTASTGLLEAYREALCQNTRVKCLTISESAQRVDLIELRLLGTDVGR